MNIRNLSAGAVMLGFVLPPVAAAQVTDHLSCFAVREKVPPVSYVVDLQGPVTATRCTVRTPAKMLCLEAAIGSSTPAPPVAGDGRLASRFACYKLKCPRPQGAALNVNWTDRFGSRILTVGTAQFLCAPELVEDTTSTTPPTSTTSTTLPPTACGGADYPTCNGSCPSGAACVAVANVGSDEKSCECAPAPGCAGTLPACDGNCPEGTVCQSALTTCLCLAQ